MNSYNKWIHWKQLGNRWCWSYFQYFEGRNYNVIFERPQKPPKKLLFETPDPSQQSLSRFKDTGLFLSPATQNFHDSVEKATKLSELVYNAQKLKELQINIIESINHILNHDLVCKNPAAANFVGMVERNM